jgi:hypothetical protein
MEDGGWGNGNIATNRYVLSIPDNLIGAWARAAIENGGEMGLRLGSPFLWLRLGFAWHPTFRLCSTLQRSQTPTLILLASECILLDKSPKPP